MNRPNYDRQMQQEIEARRGERLPRLLLHACCAPCSSACLERLIPDFQITVFYYNPNIDDETEYWCRAAEERRLIGEMNRRMRAEIPVEANAGTIVGREIAILEGGYRPEDFHVAVQGLEDEPEGGVRCAVCFRLRLLETARVARERGFDCFTTTLTVSPLKDAGLLNDIGQEVAEKMRGATWLPSDFKKRGGYQRSVALSREFGLYRQDYCGCGYSRREAKNRKKVK